MCDVVLFSSHLPPQHLVCHGVARTVGVSRAHDRPPAPAASPTAPHARLSHVLILSRPHSPPAPRPALPSAPPAPPSADIGSPLRARLGGGGTILHNSWSVVLSRLGMLHVWLGSKVLSLASVVRTNRRARPHIGAHIRTQQSLCAAAFVALRMESDAHSPP